LGRNRAGDVCVRCALEHALERTAVTPGVAAARESAADSGNDASSQGGQETHSSGGFTSAATGGQKFGDYELLEEIARGGMGVVFKARQSSLDRLVAVKMLLFGPLASAAEVQRFRAEAAAAASLQHPNIVAVHEVGFRDGQHFIAMDYVAGRSLAELVRDGPLPAPRAAAYAKTIAEAIHCAHEHGVLHRDLKPSNVLMDASDQPKVMDFGLAKRLDKETELTLSGQVLGSPSYMPPEQAAADRGLVGKRSDIFSLGAILYHLLTGRAPFAAATVAETLQQVQHAEPVSPTVLNPHVPRDLKTICLKCLEKEPARRYQTAQELAEDLGRWLRKEPIQARPVSRPEKLWRWCRRKPLVASLSAAVMVALLAGFAGVLWQWTQSETNRALAQAAAYAAEMNLAHHAIQVNNLGRARELLDRHRPKAGQKDLRGWEWRYLWGRFTSDAVFRLCRLPESDSVISTALRPGTGWVALGGYRGSGVELWDLSTRRRLERFAQGEGDAHVAFSPDGSLLAFSTTGKKGALRVWDCSKRELIVEKPLDRRIAALAFSGDGQKLTTFQPNTSVTCWRASDLEPILSVPVSAAFNSGLGTPLAVTSDGRTAVGVNGRDGFVVLDLESGGERWRTNVHLGYSPAVAISSDGARLAAASVSPHASIQLWDLATGARLGRLEGHEAWISALRFWHDGRTLVSASADQTIRLWDLDRGQPTRTLRGHQHEIWTLDMSPDAATLVSGGKDGEVLVWDTAREPERRNAWTLAGRYWGWQFSPDGRAIHAVERATNAPAHRGWRWAKAGRAVHNVPGLEYHPGRLVRCQGAGFGRIEVVPEIELAGDFVFSPSGRWLATAATNGVARVWDLNQAALADEFPSGNTDFRPVAFSADETRLWLLQGDERRAVRSVLTEWNVRTGEPLRSVTGVRDRHLALHPDGWVFWVDDEGSFVFHDLRTGRTSQPAMSSGRLGLLLGYSSPSPAGDLLVLSHELGVLTVWETASLIRGAGARSLATLRGFLTGFGDSGFSPDGTRLASGGFAAEAIKLYETRGYRELLTLGGAGDRCHNLRFSADGRHLGALNEVGQIHLWHAPTSEEIEAETKAAQAASAE